MFENFLRVQKKLPPGKLPPPPRKIAPYPSPNTYPNLNPRGDLLGSIYSGGGGIFFPVTFSKAAYFCREKFLFSILTHLKPYLNERILYRKILT